MDRIERRERLLNHGLVLTGGALAIGLLFVYRGGLGWFRAGDWPGISLLEWLCMALALVLSLAFQYHLLLLLRHGLLKYLVLWGIPVAWLFYNGLMALNLLLASSTDTAFSGGWLSLGDLLGFVAGAVFLPLLAGFGVIIAMVDSSSGLAAPVCRNADISLQLMGITAANSISYGLHLAAVIWDQIAASFTQEWLYYRNSGQTLAEISSANLSRFPYWIQSLGYTPACMLY